MLRALKRANIRDYLLATTFSSLGNSISAFACLFIAYELTSSEWHTTLSAAATTAPYLIVGLPGGIVADWYPKQFLLQRLSLVYILLLMTLFIIGVFGALFGCYSHLHLHYIPLEVSTILH